MKIFYKEKNYIYIYIYLSPIFYLALKDKFLTPPPMSMFSPYTNLSSILSSLLIEYDI